MKKALIILSSVLAIATSATAQSRQYRIPVNDFTRLKVSGSVNVNYRQSADSAGYAVFSAPAEQVSLFSFNPSKDQLTVDFKPLEGYAVPVGLPTITVYSRFLTSVENNGDSLVRVVAPAPVPEFKAKVAGNGTLSVHSLQCNKVSATLQFGHGNIALNGEATEASFSLIGQGSIQALDLKTTNVKCHMLGTGYVECSPSGELTVKGAGSGKVYYRGEPVISDKVMIGGKVVKLDDNE